MKEGVRENGFLIWKSYMTPHAKKNFLFWKSQEPIVEAMYRVPLIGTFEAQEKQEILSHLPCFSGKTVLDLASGIGRFTRGFSSSAKHLISVDMTEHFVEKNRLSHRDCSNVSYICSDALHLKIQESSLDFIFINWLLMYLSDAQVKILFQKMHQWLKPEGEIFFRESCAAVRHMSKEPDYLAHYRTLGFYDAVATSGFSLLKEGHLQTYVDFFANPFQCFWRCKKKSKPGLYQISN